MKCPAAKETNKQKHWGQVFKNKLNVLTWEIHY